MAARTGRNAGWRCSPCPPCRSGRCSFVRPFPIGIDFDEHTDVAESEEVAVQMDRWRKELALPGKLLGIGIDRLATPRASRTGCVFSTGSWSITPPIAGSSYLPRSLCPAAQLFLPTNRLKRRWMALLPRSTAGWGTASWRPIVLLKRHYTQVEMIALHRLAQFCVVASLHDGMNLVAKKFVASRTDEDGVLILSKFTGAARELKEALHINPFSIEEGAEAYRAGTWSASCSRAARRP